MYLPDRDSLDQTLVGNLRKSGTVRQVVRAFRNSIRDERNSSQLGLCLRAVGPAKRSGWAGAVFFFDLDQKKIIFF